MAAVPTVTGNGDLRLSGRAASVGLVTQWTVSALPSTVTLAFDVPPSASSTAVYSWNPALHPSWTAGLTLRPGVLLNLLGALNPVASVTLDAAALNITTAVGGVNGQVINTLTVAPNVEPATATILTRTK